MLSKRNRVAALADRFGLTAVLRLLPEQPSLVVLNYHRIGDAKASPWDSGVFSADVDQFRDQIAYLKSRHPILNLEQALAFVEGRAKLNGTSVLITFDDGYLDNYELAFPILRNFQVPATFFLPTSFIGTSRIPWWDTIAYLLKRCQKTSISLEYPTRRTFNLDRASIASTIVQILDLYKSPATADGERLLSELESVTGEQRPGKSTRCFLDWEEAREMLAGGMSVASHTDTHDVLSKKPLADQAADLIRARDILTERLQATGDVLAYPIGSRDAFNDDTIRALENAGYRAAFSFYGGFNLPGRTQRYDIRRFSVNRDTTLHRLHIQMSVAATTARVWF
ncbi:MAG: polysaccharide deacetylase family protein [Candidatus Acidiferrum sp.]